MSYNKVVGEYICDNCCIVWCKFIEDDYKIISGSSDGKVKIFESSTCDCLFTFKCHKNNILDCDLNNKNNELLSCGLDNIINVIDLKNYEIINSYEGNNKNGYIKTVRYLKNNENFVSGESNGKIVIWSIKDNINRIGIIENNNINSIIMSLCVISDDIVLSSSNDGYLKLYNIKSKKSVSPLSFSLSSLDCFVSKMLLDERFGRIICVSFDGHILIYSLSDYSLLKVKSVHCHSVESICLSDDCLYLYIGSSIGKIYLIEL